MTNDNDLLDRTYRHGDRIMVGVIWLLMVTSLGLAGWYDTWSEALMIGLPAALVPSALLALAPGTRVSRLSNAAAFMIFSALMIHQAHGMIEMHFGIFVLLAFLLFYRDWLPVVAAAALIAVHHLTFNYLQTSGAPVYVFAGRTGIDLVLVHAAYVVFEAAILVYMAAQFRREAIQSAELHDIGRHLSTTGENLDLKYRKAGAVSDFAVGFNVFMDAVHAAVSSTRAAADRLLGASNDLSTITERSSHGAQQQQSETEQVATAMNQMTATVQDVSQNAHYAADGALKADEEARNGARVVSDTIKAIHALAGNVENASGVIQRLESESENIGSVLDVIRGIAEQTNLLALNAAIEAARAGEQGRGFAVVADEVRTLASRTQQSTAEIQEMIQRLQVGSKDAVAVMEEGRRQTQAGVEQAARAGESLQRITESITTIRDMNAQIASAAEQQASVAEEINRSIVSISQVADETSLGMREAAMSSNQLTEYARQLQERVERFDV